MDADFFESGGEFSIFKQKRKHVDEALSSPDYLVQFFLLLLSIALMKLVLLCNFLQVSNRVLELASRMELGIE